MKYLVIILLLLVVPTKQLIAADKLLQPTDFTYLGAFKVPDGAFGCDPYTSFGYSGNVVAYNSANNSIFMGEQKHNCIGEINIPATLGTPGAAVSSLPIATVRQNFEDITEGNSANTRPGGEFYSGTVWLGGLLKYNNKLLGTVFPYYDDGSNTLSHYTSGTTLATTGDFGGMYQVSNNGTAIRFVAGPMAPIPDNSATGGTNWQSVLGGPALTFQGTTGINSGTSWGPAAFSFDPDNLGVVSPVPTTSLLWYSMSHPTLGASGDGGIVIPSPTNNMFNSATRYKGVAFPPGTKTVLYTGIHGVGEYCYGVATGTPDLLGTLDPEGHTYECYSPFSGKGPNAYPFNYQVLMYNADDLSAAKAGTKQPWEITPYSIWRLPVVYPKIADGVDGGASTYDSVNNKLYVVQTDANKFGDNPAPVVHVFQVNVIGTSPAAYTVGGTVTGLTAPIYLQNNGGDYIRIASNGSYSFLTEMTSGATYSVARKTSYDSATDMAIVAAQMAQNCTISNSTGTVTGNVTNVNINCGSSTPISGSCGSSNGLALSTAPSTGLCSAGTPSAVSGTGPWSWTCAGSGGGNTASCGATLANQARSVSIKLGSGGKMTGILR